jgi:hypothetical protein
MKILKIFLALLASAVMLFTLDLLSDSFSLAERACYAWSATTTFGCTMSFFSDGLLMALTKNFWLSPFFAGVEIVSTPAATIGWVTLATLIAVSLLGLFWTIRLARGALRSAKPASSASDAAPPSAAPTSASATAPTAAPSPAPQLLRDSARPPRARQPRKFSTDFFVALALLVGIGWCAVRYMAFAVARNEGRAETGFVAPLTSLPADLGLVTTLAESMQKHQIPAEELRRKVDEAVAKKDLDPTSTAKLYNVALGACQVDYLEALEKFPQQPSLDTYDRNAMRSLYLAAKSDECDKYFQKMGWSQGCEVTPVADACQDLTTHWQQYQQNFRKAQKDAAAPPCTKDEDCFLSEAGACGERLIGSKLEIDPAIDQLENVLACPLRKRAALCLRQNPRAFAECPQRTDEFAVCRESICKAIPLNEKLHPSSSPVPPELILTQSFLFKNDQDCSEQISATTQRFGHPTAAEILSNSCDSKYFQGLAEIAHARVAAVLTKSGKPTRVRLKILKNYGRIALPENFEMDWPAPLFSRGSRDIVFETPKVGVEGIFGFYESSDTRIAPHPLQPKLSEAARRTVTRELLTLLEANQKKFPTPKQVRQILAARELNRQKSCNHYDRILGETNLPVIDVMVEKSCPRGFTYFNQAPGAKSNKLILFLRGEHTVGEVNERLKTCGGQIHETGIFLSIIIPSAKNVAEMEKVQKCYEEKGIFETSIEASMSIEAI